MKFSLILSLVLLSASFAAEFSVNVPVPSEMVEMRELANYTSVSIPGMLSVTREGAPALPVMTATIALPRGTQAASVEVTDVSWTALRGRHTVLPATAQVPISLMDQTEVPIPVPDSDIYSSTEVWPAQAARLEGSSMLMGHPVAYVTVNPVRWNPASGTVEVMNNLEISITTEAGDNYQVRARSAQSEQRIRAMVESTVVNPDMVQASGAVIVPSRDLTYGEYVVIATPAYESYAQEFADWKTRKGIPTSVYTTTWIQTQYSCTDLQQEIRAFLTDCRDEGVEYVLIWGDDNIIAGRDARIHYSTYTEYPPVDLYWSDINDSAPGADQWNSNGNSIWGEYGSDNVDYHPDLLTGRASVNSTSEAELFLDKVLAYEQIGSTDYFETAPAELRIGYTTELLWGSPYNCYGSAGAEIISGYVPSASWEEEKCYDSAGNNSPSITTAMINAGPNHVYHASHGSATGFSLPGGSYSTSNIMALQNISNGHLPAIWNSISCLIGHLDGNECCGDAWLASPNGGGFGAFNARYGWGNPSSPGDGASEVLCQKIYDEHWNEGQVTLGGMHFFGRDELCPPSSEVMDWCVKEYNLFGEPELPIWTADAPQLSATHPSTISGSTSVDVTVSAGGSPVSGARVCLYKGDDWSTAEVYEVATTNGSGQVTIPVNPTTTGEMLITVWAYNNISYLGTITVGGTGIGDQVEGNVYVNSISTPFPNPATTSAAIPFSMSTAGMATVQVFDLAGRSVATLASGEMAAGQHALNWDLSGSNGASVPSGFYSVVVTTPETVMTERIMVIR